MTAFSAFSSASTTSTFTLGRKVHDVFGSAVKFRVALLTTKTLCFGDGDSLQANFLKGLLHFIELEGA
jgi:hypothetical protein